MCPRWKRVFGFTSRWMLLTLLVSGVPTGADPASEEVILPPELPWKGKSRILRVHKDHPWITPAERSGLTRTPRYRETVSWLQRLTDAADELEMVSIGVSPEGREIWMVVASREQAFSAEALRRTGKPTLLAQAGIHAGEIDGKDAGMMLLRDLTVGGSKHRLLERVNFLFIPIFNVDGHEKFSRFSRLNQRGPVESGWRTTSRRLNLNRDYAKLDTPEMRSMVRTLDRWDPDLYIDIHVTDGLDYQYDITFGYTGPHGHSPESAAWLDEFLAPALNRDLRRMGHTPGPLIFPRDRNDPKQGITEWTGSPRYSNGYGDVRHLPTLLVENHSLKPYEQRVLGTYVFLESALRILGRRGRQLREAIAADRSRRPRKVPLTWKTPPGEPQWMEYLGVESREFPSPISGVSRLEWTGKPVTLRVPHLVVSEPAVTVSRPRAYWIPPAWNEVIRRLETHGVLLERIPEERELEVELYRILEPELAESPFEGHVRVSGKTDPERRKRKFPPGTVRVPTDQPLGDLAILLLEPDSPDSFFQWGFFHEILQRTEYPERYVLEPMAERMLAGDPSLRSAFERKLREDPDFAGNPGERVLWFYERTPFFDRDWRVYPVARE